MSQGNQSAQYDGKQMSWTLFHLDNERTTHVQSNGNFIPDSKT